MDVDWDKIKIIKVKKQDIIKQLQEKGYPEVDNYDYLLKMPIYNLSLEKIEDFEEKLKKMQEELDMINSKSDNETFIAVIWFSIRKDTTI